MTELIIFGIIIVGGVVYALKPEKFLARKYKDEGVPDLAVRTARVAGVFVALVGVMLLLNTLQ